VIKKGCHVLRGEMDTPPEKKIERPRHTEDSLSTPLNDEIKEGQVSAPNAA